MDAASSRTFASVDWLVDSDPGAAQPAKNSISPSSRLLSERMSATSVDSRVLRSLRWIPIRANPAADAASHRCLNVNLGGWVNPAPAKVT